MIDTNQVKELRNKTGISIMQCRKALEESNGDMEKAEVILRRQSKSVADKKAERELKSGVIGSYLHSNGLVGAMVELLCESDFVAKNEEFKKLAYDLAMQVTATNPEYLKREDIPDNVKQKATEILEKEIEGSKPKDIKAKILEGKLNSYFSDKILLEQSFIKDQNFKVSQLIESAIQKIGERIEIGKFVRFSI